MDQQPKIPTLKDAQKPQVKIKGMGAGLTLFDRLKQFKKKDLAFILAGLGTLFMAPLAEHFMMAPENGDSNLQQGWGKGGAGSNLFGSGSSPYENGNNSIAQGGAIGGSGDIITPLNVRDPSALVMGPGAAMQPNAGSIAPATAPTAPARSETDYKDALAGAASRAASAAVKRAPLPVPKVALGGSGLRGLGAASGGSSSGSGGLGNIGGNAGGTAGTGGGGLNLVRTGPNFRGAAGPRGNGPQGLDGTRKAGQNAGDAFSRTGSALGGLNAAASETIPTGGSGFNGGGQGGAGANDKPGGGSGPGGSKNVGESLAFIEAKERMMENLKLEFEKRKLKDNELLMYGIRNDLAKASASKIGEALTKKFMCMGGMGGCPAADEDYMCNGTKGGAFTQSGTAISANLCTGAGKDGNLSVEDNCYKPGGLNTYTIRMGGDIYNCLASGKAGGAAKPDPNAKPVGSDGPSGISRSGPSVAVDKLCSGVDTVIAGFSAKPVTKPGEPASTIAATTGDKAKYTVLRQNIDSLLTARNSLTGGSADGTCGASAGGKSDTKAYHVLIAQSMADTKPSTTGQPGALPGLQEIADKTTEQGTPRLGTAQSSLEEARANLANAQAQLTAGKTALEKIKAVSFAAPDTAGASLSPALVQANALKTELSAYADVEGAQRQKTLQDAYDLANANAKGNAVAVMKTNTTLDNLKKAFPTLDPAPKEGDPVPAKPAAPNVANDGEVTAAIGKADTALKTACGGKPCEAPAPVPEGTTASAPGVPSEEAKAALASVKAAQAMQSAYIGTVMAKVTPGAPK